MALEIIDTYEYEENELTYVYTKYQRDDGGITEERVIKQQPYQEPSPKPITLEDLQAQIEELQAQGTTTGEQVAEMYAAQTGDVVSKTELDNAYREGVNSVG